MSVVSQLPVVGRIAPRGRSRLPGTRMQPQRLVLGPARGVSPIRKPPVRIFIGTEPGQHRAERVLIWSIEQVRDPARTYEIYLMKDLAGFDRRRWLTGFTNYRFVIPHLAGGSGRAIYNDVDQIYLNDPAELFDRDMQGHGFLAISDRDTSVMLIDCERMASIWTLDLARTLRRKAIEARARAIPGTWGRLEGVWNARDAEYVAGRSKVLHFTTIHTQPWRPFPEMFAYQSNPVDHVWRELERSADAAGFQVFGFSWPSVGYLETVTRLRATSAASSARLSSGPPQRDPAAQWFQDAAGQLDPQTVLEYRLAAGDDQERPPEVMPLLSPPHEVTRFEPARAGDAAPPSGVCDAVVCSGGLPYLSDEDVPWVLEELFKRARRGVFAVVNSDEAARLPIAVSSSARRRDWFWWLAHFEAVSARNRDVHWRLVWRGRNAVGRPLLRMREGGHRLGGAPRVWVLADHKAGHTTQSVGLAEALGWPYEVKSLQFTARAPLHGRWSGATLIALDKGRSAALEPPWPDLVITTGRYAAPVARWIADRSLGRTRLVQLGRKGGEAVEHLDLVVACEYFRLPVHPRRIRILAPLNQVGPDCLARAAARWRGLFDGAPRPHVALLVGGSSALHVLDAATAQRLGEQVLDFARSAGGSAFAITSPRTGADACEALSRGLGDPARVHLWRKGETENPYLGYLALADVIVVTGESESMLAEAAATGKPVYVYPIPERPATLRSRFREWVTAKAYSRPRKEKGTVRPQQGLEYVCARLIERGIVRPTRNLNQLHDSLIRHGFAIPFGRPLETNPREPLREVEGVARRVRGLFGDVEPLPPSRNRNAPNAGAQLAAAR